jgi:hypothetical protein
MAFPTRNVPQEDPSRTGPEGTAGRSAIAPAEPEAKTNADADMEMAAQAFLDFGQVHDAIDQARPAARTLGSVMGYLLGRGHVSASSARILLCSLRMPRGPAQGSLPLEPLRREQAA